MPSSLVSLGLDLRGGAHLLAEVHVQGVHAVRMELLWPQVRDALHDLRDQVGSVRRQNAAPGELRVTLTNPGDLVLPSADEPGVFYILDRSPAVSGENLVDAQPAFDQNNRPAVSFRFDPAGARVFGDYTAANIGQPFAIVLAGEVISAPVIQSHIPGGSGIITGQFTVEGSTELAVLLRAGALPAGMTFLEERTIGPELGADSIAAGQRAAVIGMVAVVAFMVACYGGFGLMANLALALNMGMLLAALSVMGATLTLPGIAGIVLTMGMAVDANALIFERIREELREGRAAGRAIEIGFEKALSAIMDSNITGLLTALIMFAVGSGPVRGFAVTLGLGILTSMFTAVYVTRLIIETWMRWKRPKTIALKELDQAGSEENDDRLLPRPMADVWRVGLRSGGVAASCRDAGPELRDRVQGRHDDPSRNDTGNRRGQLSGGAVRSFTR